MKMNKSFLGFIALMLIFAAVSFAAPTRGSFAYGSYGARPLAMGGAFSAIADDGNAAYYNSAGLAFIENKYFLGAYTKPYELDCMKNFYLSYSQPDFGLGSAGLYWANLIVSDLVKDEEGNTWDDWSEHVIGYSLAMEVPTKMKNLRIGVGASLKGFYVNTNIEDDNGHVSSGSGGGFDLGIMLKYKYFSVGANFKDVYSFISYQDHERDILPFTYDAGIGINLLKNYILTTNFVGDKDDALKKIAFGAEASLFKNILMLRGGIANHFGEESRMTLHTGLGINYNNFIFDYAFVLDDEDKALGNSHFFGVTLKF